MSAAAWPALSVDRWRDTYATLHRWTQITGKVVLALTPRVNHFWNAAFLVTPRGLASQAMWSNGRALTLEFDFVEHRLRLECSDGNSESVALEPRTVAEFYRLTMQALHRMSVDVRIWTMPVEIPDPIPFEKDTIHRSYDPEAAQSFWRALVAMKPVFEDFRCRFIGKCSPVHFFWGSFDLAVTRFSGRPAPARPGADAVTLEAYSHEVISHGFWLGGAGDVDQPAFYAYAAPEPEGLKTASVGPAEAFYSSELSEFILPYDAVRNAASPPAALTAFLESTYDRAATLAGWNRPELERKEVGHGRT